VFQKCRIARYAHYSLRFPPRASSVKADKHERHSTAVRLLQRTQLIMWVGLHVIHTDDNSNSRSIFGLVSLLRLLWGRDFNITFVEEHSITTYSHRHSHSHAHAHTRARARANTHARTHSCAH